MTPPPDNPGDGPIWPSVVCALTAPFVWAAGYPWAALALLAVAAFFLLT